MGQQSNENRRLNASTGRRPNRRLLTHKRRQGSRLKDLSKEADKGTIARGRAAVYLWLAKFFLAPPTHESLKEQLESKMLDGIRDILGPAGDKPLNDLMSVGSSLGRGETSRIRQEYDELFLIPIKGQHIPLYESAFREKTETGFGGLWGPATAEAKEVYKRAGFEAQLQDQIFAPDHLGLELAFMSTLAIQEAKAIANREKSTRPEIQKLQTQFLTDHLNNWLRDFALTVQSKLQSGFFASVSAIADTFVNEDLRYMLGDAICLNDE